MSQIRIYELAKNLRLPSKNVLEIAKSIGIEASTNLTGIDSSEADKIKREIERNPSLTAGLEVEVIEKKIEPKVESKADKKEIVETKATEVTVEEEKKSKRKSLENKKDKIAKDSETEVKKDVDKTAAKDEQVKQVEKKQVKTKKTEQADTKKNKESKPKASETKKEKPKVSKDAKENTKTDKSKSEKRDTVQQQNEVKKESGKSSENINNEKAKPEKHYKKSDKKKKTGKKKYEEKLENDGKTKRNNKKRLNRNKNVEKENESKPRTYSMQKKTRKKKAKKKKEVLEEPMTIEIEQQVSVIKLPERTTVGEFATLIDKPVNDIILRLMNLGVMAAINQYIDYDTMALIAEDFSIEVDLIETEVDEAVLSYDYEDSEEDLKKRAPVVTVMGHVDHGKTSLLDAIRSTNVTSVEAGGITQHIGASEIHHNDQKIVFLDTPGHEAFTSLRARGAQVTDIAILVVAADDGVMPQTVEAIDHARAADVPIIVAINKIDKAGAQPDRVKKELSEQGLLVEDWGGDVISVDVSAHTGENVDVLLEMVLLVAEMQELAANPERNAVGVVLEANLDKGKGPVATVLIQNGHIKIGDPFVCGTTYGRVRALLSSTGKRIKKAGPSTAVEITGINDVPLAGDKFFVIDSDKEAKQIAADRANELTRLELEKANNQVTLEDIFNQIQSGQMKELNLIIKADAHGSLEALKGSISKLNNDSDEVNIKVKHANIGAITESDILLATASNTIVLGFNVRPSSSVIALAKRENVEIKTYRIIYELLNDLEAAIKGMLDPEFKEEQLGEVEVRATFKVPNVGMIAGGYVLSGKVLRNSQVRLLREGVIIHEGELSSLKRFKDDVKEVVSGYECGLGIKGYDDLKEGDIIEAYHTVEVARD